MTILKATLPKDKQPRVIARERAVLSTQDPVGKNQVAQLALPPAGNPGMG
jgi:hypothetical protein